MKIIFLSLFLSFVFPVYSGRQNRQNKQSIPPVEVVQEPVRPQNPIKPYPYQEEEVFFCNKRARIKLAGTFTYPEGEGSFPTVVLIGGSGPFNRNGEMLGHKPLLVLADQLTRSGIAVLRFDKRGIGESGGVFDSATVEHFARDVIAAVAYLRKRPEVNLSQIGLVGHSQGGQIAAKVSADCKAVSYLVMMGAPGVSGRQIILDQIMNLQHAAGIEDEMIALNRDLFQKMINVIKKIPSEKKAKLYLDKLIKKYVDQFSEEELALTGYTEEALYAQAKRMNKKPFRFFLNYNPSKALKKVQIPALALFGSHDLQVSPKQNLPAITKALTGNPKYSAIIIPGLNHMFQTCETGHLAEYEEIEETISPLVLDRITDWILIQAEG